VSGHGPPCGRSRSDTGTVIPSRRELLALFVEVGAAGLGRSHSQRLEAEDGNGAAENERGPDTADASSYGRGEYGSGRYSER